MSDSMEGGIGTVTFVTGNILDAKEQYICHQCNCTSRGSKGLAKTIFTAWPWANIYNLDRTGMLGEILISHCPSGDKPSVIHMLAQYAPVSRTAPERGLNARKGLFLGCLRKIQNIQDLESVAFPDHIGCGLAGGQWDVYLDMITKFATNNDVRVVIYKHDTVPHPRRRR